MQISRLFPIPFHESEVKGREGKWTEWKGSERNGMEWNEREVYRIEGKGMGEFGPY